jgi:hypothetical protein
LQGRGKDGASANATIVTEAQFFFVISIFSAHNGAILGAFSLSSQQADKETVNE